MTKETAIKKQIKDYLRLKGWFVFHNLQSLGSYAGIPDLTAIKNGLVVFIEVKTSKGKQSVRQKEFEINIKQQKGYYFIVTGYEDLESIIYLGL